MSDIKLLTDVEERQPSRRPLPADRFQEENNVRMRKFAESLMRQRQLRELKHSDRKSSPASPGKLVSPNKVERESSLDIHVFSGDEYEPADRQEPRSLPLVERSTSETVSPGRVKSKKSSKIKRSTSLTEVSGVTYEKERSQRSYSNSQLSPDQVRTSQMSG